MTKSIPDHDELETTDDGPPRLVDLDCCEIKHGVESHDRRVVLTTTFDQHTCRTVLTPREALAYVSQIIKSARECLSNTTD
jgi:hypothetical protein